MDPTTMSDPRVQALVDQLDTILIVLQRPVVQRQLVAFVFILFASWILPAPLGVLLKRLVAQQTEISNQRKAQGLPAREWRAHLLRWARALQLLLFPIVGLLFSQIAQAYFFNQGWPGGLLNSLTAVFWLILAYRVLGTIVIGSLAQERATRLQRRFVAPIFIILVTLVVRSALGGTLPISEIELFQILETPITLQTIAVSIVVFYVFLAIAWVMNDVLSGVVLPRTQADSGIRTTVLVITRYTLIGMGLLAALGTLGFDLSSVAIIFGGLSVGIGFGMQELVANFISGLLLLFERSLRPGDMIEVEGQRGTVTKLGMRATVLRTFDNIEVFVPNKTLLTSTVSTYTLTDRTTRRLVTVGVSYDSDPTQVRDILLELMKNHGLVLDNPEPAVFFMGFGDSSLDFQCAFWIDDPLRGLKVDSDIRHMIFREFGKHGIEIPFPQRDLHVRSASGLAPELLQAKEPTTAHSESESNGAGRTEALQPAPAERLSPERVRAPQEKPNLPG